MGSAVIGGGRIRNAAGKSAKKKVGRIFCKHRIIISIICNLTGIKLLLILKWYMFIAIMIDIQVIHRIFKTAHFFVQS